MNWDDWRGSLDGRPTMWIRRMAKVRGRRLDLHKFVRPDDVDCFHTHPAPAIRAILWGGYVEQLEDGTLRTWRPGDVGIVRPALCHRVHRLLNGPSYSIWIRGRICADVALRGAGWPRSDLMSNGVVIYEMSEVSAFTKEEADSLKAFLATKPADFQLPFEDTQ